MCLTALAGQECGGQPNIELKGSTVLEDILTPWIGEGIKTPQECCTRCRNQPGCQIWAYCPIDNTRQAAGWQSAAACRARHPWRQGSCALRANLLPF